MIADKYLLITLSVIINVNLISGAAIIGNGEVILGVDDEGQLNVPYYGGFLGLPITDPLGIYDVGLRNGGGGTVEVGEYAATEPGCLCEGWGVGISNLGIYVTANNARSISNINLVSFSGSNGDSSATSHIRDTTNNFEVIHYFYPSPDSIYAMKVDVTIKNIGLQTFTDIIYRRTMDWDIYPTPFSEYVTIIGTDADKLILSNDNGFCDSNPFATCTERTAGTTNVDFTDSGPSDHGANFDFDLGDLNPGEETQITIYYGCAPGEVAALQSLHDIGAEVASLGQSAVDGATGLPHTFFFAFGKVNGTVIEAPPTSSPTTAVPTTDSPTTASPTTDAPSQAPTQETIDIHPECGKPTSRTARVTSTLNGIATVIPIVFRSVGGACINPTIDVIFEEIDFSSPSYEYFDVFDQDNNLISRCTADQDGNCGNWETCLDDEALPITEIADGDTYELTIEGTRYLNTFCSPYSLNVNLTITCDAEASPFIYVPTPSPYFEARQYCKHHYGTDLATVSNDWEREEASLLIGNETVWFGLYSRSEGGNWRFLNKDPCTNTESRYKCIDFWKYRLNRNAMLRPRCIGPSEGGYQCANFEGGCKSENNNGGSDHYNIQFVVDESGSVGSTNYYASIDFIKDLIDDVINDYPTKISVYSFNSSPTQLYSFSDTQDDGRAGVHAALDAETFSSGGTATLDALETSIYDFENAASITPSDTNFIFLLTDGVPNSSSNPCSGSADALAMLDRIDAYNIRLITIGIGSFNVASIDCLSTDEDTFEIDGFTDDDFAGLEESLGDTIFSCDNIGVADNDIDCDDSLPFLCNAC